MSLDGAIQRLDRLLVALTILLIAGAGVGVALWPDHDTAPVTRSALPAQGARPTGLVIPSIDLHAKVVRIEVKPSGALDPPEDIDLVGWWQRSAKAGSVRGQTVLTGHNASHADGVMDHLHQVRKGATVHVQTPKGRATYRVTRQVELDHTQLADRAVALFGQQRKHHRLVLVTCSDYRNGVWNKNVIVFAKPVGR